MEKIKVGVIGAGTVSAFHLNAYRQNPAVDLVSICDINEVLVKKRATEYGVARLYSDYRRMLEAEKLDAVSVCTWNSEHYAASIAALQAGANVLCEKPMALDARAALHMKETADALGKLLMVGFVRRFGDDCKIVKDFINNGYFGELYYAKAMYLRRQGNPGGWFGDRSRSGGGPLIDLGIHVVDLTRYWLGNPKPISVYGVSYQKLLDRKKVISKPKYRAVDATDDDLCDVEDFITALIRYENGVVVSVETSFSMNIKEDIDQIELFGTKAGAKLSPALEIFGEQNGHMTNVSLATETAFSFEGSFKKEITHFVDCVRLGIPCRSPAEDGVWVMRVLDAIYRSARMGREVLL